MHDSHPFFPIECVLLKRRKNAPTKTLQYTIIINHENTQYAILTGTFYLLNLARFICTISIQTNVQMYKGKLYVFQGTIIFSGHI
jgi:hypothetical protein